MNENIYDLWLLSIPHINYKKYLGLLKHFDNSQNLWNINSKELNNITFLDDIAKSQILDPQYKSKIEKDAENIYNKNIKILTIASTRYPENLKNIYNPPTILYVKTNLPDVDFNITSVAMVGSRYPTPYGTKVAQDLSSGLAKQGLTIISGFARGIDTCAHIGAINGNGKTIAVLGCGLDTIYPPENKILYEKIQEYGYIISEYPLGTPPIPINFPLRNRIISGLSFGVIVVEAQHKSGSLITSDFALEQGREVFAVPGNITSPQSEGTNNLIKQGAKLVCNVNDILEEIPQYINSFLPKQLNFFSNNINTDSYSNDEKIIITNLSYEPLHIDKLSAMTGFSTSKISSLLTMLELDGIIKQLPGKFLIKA